VLLGDHPGLTDRQDNTIVLEYIINYLDIRSNGEQVDELTKDKEVLDRLPSHKNIK